jgi:protease-4
MSLHADTLLDRLRLKSQIRRWQIVTLLIALFSIIILIEANAKGRLPINTSDYIARISIEGFIADDFDQQALIKEVAEDDQVKAVILRIDSPGGSAVGGEGLYLAINELREKKPVVAVMRSMATSAAYMAAIGADHIVAREGTITGSIGVIFQSAEFTDLFKQIGIKPITIKSAPLKGSPSPFEKFSSKQRAMLESVIDDFYESFVSYVVARRPIEEANARKLADGSIYTGKQAVQNKLIDAIGGEQEALAWLQKEKQIDTSLDVEDVKVHKEDGNLFEKLANFSYKQFFNEKIIHNQGLNLIWAPELN